MKSNLYFSATAKKEIVKLLSAAVLNKCFGYQISTIPLVNSLVQRLQSDIQKHQNAKVIPDSLTSLIELHSYKNRS